MRRVGALMGYAENDPEAKVFFAGFTQRLAEMGWVKGYARLQRVNATRNLCPGCASLGARGE